MSKIKKWIIILSIICIALIIMLIYFISSNSENINKSNIIDEQAWEPTYNIDQTVQLVEIRNNFYIVKGCVENFYTCYCDIFKNPLEDYRIQPEEGTVDTEKIKNKRIEKLYKMLDEEYLSYSGITLENLSAKLPKVGSKTITIENMYYVEKDQNISAYFIYGKMKDSLDSKTTDFSMMVKIDTKNRTYKVLLGDFVEKYYKDIKIGDRIEIKDDEISNDIYNSYTYENITDEEYINDLFTHYKNSLRNNREQTYNLLNEQYKEKCFENLEEYLSYLDTNYSKIVSAILDTYNKDKNSDYTQYLFKDTKGNYYIFKETSPFKYTVQLDNYTIPTEDFTETYNSSSDVEQVILNIKKFFMGIDDKNYGYSYSVLSESFKKNKYPTKNDFINYAKQNFFEENEIQYVSYEKENGLYIYKIKISDATGTSSEVRKFNMIIKLNSGTDFEMSFGTN